MAVGPPAAKATPPVAATGAPPLANAMGVYDAPVVQATCVLTLAARGTFLVSVCAGAIPVVGSLVASTFSRSVVGLLGAADVAFAAVGFLACVSWTGYNSRLLLAHLRYRSLAAHLLAPFLLLLVLFNTSASPSSLPVAAGSAASASPSSPPSLRGSLRGGSLETPAGSVSHFGATLLVLGALTFSETVLLMSSSRIAALRPWQLDGSQKARLSLTAVLISRARRRAGDGPVERLVGLGYALFLVAFSFVCITANALGLNEARGFFFLGPHARPSAGIAAAQYIADSVGLVAGAAAFVGLTSPRPENSEAEHDDDSDGDANEKAIETRCWRPFNPSRLTLASFFVAALRATLYFPVLMMALARADVCRVWTQGRSALARGTYYDAAAGPQQTPTAVHCSAHEKLLILILLAWAGVEIWCMRALIVSAHQDRGGAPIKFAGRVGNLTAYGGL